MTKTELLLARIDKECDWLAKAAMSSARRIDEMRFLDTDRKRPDWFVSGIGSVRWNADRIIKLRESAVDLQALRVGAEFATDHERNSKHRRWKLAARWSGLLW